MSEFIADHDITVITESKLNSEVTNSSLAIHGYSANRLDRNNHGGGVITYIRNNLKPTILYEHQDIASLKGLECTVTKISNGSEKKPIIILGLYRPPNVLTKWFEDMSQLIAEILPLGSLIIMGDLNADLLRPRQATSKSLKTLMSLANVKVQKTAPTRITPLSSTCLDIIAIDKSISCLNYDVGNMLISDHLPVIASIKFGRGHTIEPIIKRSLRNVNFDSLRDRVANINLQTTSSMGIDVIVDTWHKSLIDILDDTVPLKKFPWRKERCPWVTDEIRQLITKRDSLTSA